MAHHLVIQLARFGDMVQTKRLLLSLAARPEDVVHLAVDVSLVPLAERLFPFAVIHTVRAHATGMDAASLLRENKDAFAALAAIPFASVYNLNFSGMALALAGLFDPAIVRGYSRRNGQPLRSRWIRMGFRWANNRRIAPVNLVDFWAHLHPDPVPPGAVNPASAEKGGKGGKIAIVAAGREARRSLPPEILAPLVDSVFAANGGPEMIVLGGKAEAPFARKLARLVRPQVLQKLDDACGRTSLTDLPDILAGCAMVLTPDTGIMHLAAHLGVPVTAFFLSSAWCFETGPYGEGHTVFQATRSCAPCVESRPCPFSVACLPPFAAPELAAALRGKEPETWPEGLARLHTQLDDFGCDYRVSLGAVPEMPRRASLRALLSEYVGSGDGEGVEAWNADTAFHESDWVLPPERGERFRDMREEG